jgi:phenylalanyl-tRNA synthetase beta chain
LKIFELGRAFYPRKGQELPEEVELLSGLITGRREEESWAKTNAEVDFFDLKGVVETLLYKLGVDRVKFQGASEAPFLQAGTACAISAQGEQIGILGEIHGDVRQAFELKHKVFFFELDFTRTIEKIQEKRTFKALPRFPAVTRDLAIIVNERISTEDLLQVIRGANNGLIAEMKVFDLYRGNPIPAGKKSLAFRLKFQEEGRTLTDAEVNELHQRIIQLLAEKHGAILR